MAYRPWRGRVLQLLGRRGECEVLDRLVGAVRAGESRALVVCGEPGAGKTALLDYLAGQASGCLVAAAVGVQSEMDLAFAARRLGAEAVGLVFGARVSASDLAGLPELVVAGLREDDARALLCS